MRVLEHGQRASERASETAHCTHNAYEMHLKDQRLLTACESQNPSSTFLIHMGYFQPVSVRCRYISCVRMRCTSRDALTRTGKTLASCILVPRMQTHEHTHATGVTSSHLAQPRIWSQKSLLCNLDGGNLKSLSHGTADLNIFP